MIWVLGDVPTYLDSETETVVHFTQKENTTTMQLPPAHTFHPKITRDYRVVHVRRFL